MNPLRSLHGYGQSVWLDYIGRELLDSLELRRLIEEDGIVGVTSNPAIFEKSISGGQYYAVDIAKSADMPAALVYEHLALEDIRRAATELYPVYTATQGRDGYASLEVSPHLAHDSELTIEEARRLWAALGQPNTMIKVPATPAGIVAIETLIADGINVNVTLLFGVGAYRQVADAWLRGLERRAAAGGELSQVASVASFFISRIDTAVDTAIDRRLASGVSNRDARALSTLRGTLAIANARQAYLHYLEIVTQPRWRKLANQGAQPQRLLWASTGVKDPAYRDVRYIEELIGSDTVNTVPPATLDAFRDHGVPRDSLLEDIDGALERLSHADRLGIDLATITDVLLADGLRQFRDAHDRLIDAIVQARPIHHHATQFA
ncbi:transaldolase [Thiobacillus sp.]|uniref:transaldolase n=1 Tax=Thiobacillus sp. TaxID=924 RepID=UPI0011D4ADE1|nr:transaldolase [Thiobacillus sp.]TXH73982.1 MAG: transaldolase [Thiobacillus sp.]